MGLKGGGDDGVLSLRQVHTLRHLPQVNVGLAFGFGGGVQEEVLLQVLILSAHLRMETKHSVRKDRALICCISDMKPISSLCNLLKY